MCGIAGVWSADPRGLAAIGPMTEAIRHRGPDDEGYLLAGPGRATAFRGRDTVDGLGHGPLPAAVGEGFDLAFGHRRLSIIDLSRAGHGPMASGDGRLWITYNGEIYNYVELREELRGLGHVFTSASDTEVILAAYTQWGPDALRRFNGMWAFAIYDARERVLFCARDRFGVKPFHYAWTGSLLAFGSEIKAVVAHPGVPARAHWPLLHGFLVRGALDEGDETFFEGVKALPAGHWLRLDLAARSLRVERWYSLPETEPRSGDPARLRALLEDAVRLRLRSDVDVGTCLSGGLDSSAIVAMTAALRNGHSQGRHRSFSVVYSDAGLDESAHVSAVVAATGVEGARITATSEDLWRDLPKLVAHQDEPIPSPGPYSHWRVMDLAHQARVKVLLDGQGSDEVLAGYHYQYGPFLAELLRGGRPGLALRELRAASSVTGRPLGFFLGLAAYHALPLPGPLRDAALARAATHGYLPRHLVRPEFVQKAGPAPGGRHRPQRRLVDERAADLWSTSLPALLRYEDRNSMAFGIEARTPFLDYRLVEEAMSLRADSLIQDGWTKALLRQATAGLVPDSVRLRRDKLGFPTPEKRWLRELAPRVRETLASRGARVRTILDGAALDAWLARDDAALAGQRGLWRLLAAEMWLAHVDTLARPAGG